MDDFVAMLERATESAPPAVVNRVLDAVTIEVAVRGSHQPARPAAASNTVTVVPRRPRDRRRWKAATAAMLAVAATVTVLTIWRRPDGAPAVSTHDPGRLPARVDLGSTGWTLTWLPPDYEPTHATGNGIRLTSPDQPAIDITARRGEIPIVAPLLQLAPLAEAHHDDAAGVLQWNQAGWSFTLDAAAVIPSALLLRLAVAIVPDSGLTAPTANRTSTVQVPDVVGLDYREATARLRDAGFSIRWAISSTAASGVGTVERVTPVAGSTAKAGSAVTLGVIGVASGMPPLGDALVSGDLPDAVGYYPNWLRDRAPPNLMIDNVEPIVFLHGELVGYGVGDRFDPLLQAAINVPRPAFTSTETTVGTAPVDSAGPQTSATLIALTATSPVLAPTRTLFDLTGYENGALTMSPDGRIVVGKVDGAQQHLLEIRADGSPFDLGIDLQAGAALAFGPRGDLFAVEYMLDGSARAKVSEYHPTPSSAWTWVASAEAGVIGECGILVTPSAAGCPATGPTLGFDPPAEFDRVVIEPSLATVTRTGGVVQRQWTVTLDLLFDLNCDDDMCSHMAAPGPNGSAVWYPYLRGQQPSQAVFVLDDRAAAGVGWLDPSITGVIGAHGSDLIAVQSIEGRLNVVAIDLQPLMA